MVVAKCGYYRVSRTVADWLLLRGGRRSEVDTKQNDGQIFRMWRINFPQPDTVREFLAAQKSAALSYGEVGETKTCTEAPSGYEWDLNRVRLGSGERAFRAACEALREWKMFPMPWTKILPAHAPIETGTTIAMLANVYGVWWLNACRVVYTIDETAPVRRFGFAYGTLVAHVERGEERFSIEWLADDSVWYDLRAFSQPRYWPVKLAKPLARAQQRRFARDSKAQMQRIVAEKLKA